MSLLIFEIGADGHRALYMNTFIAYAAAHPEIGYVSFAISDALAKRLSDEATELLRAHSNRVQMRHLSKSEIANTESRPLDLLRSRARWNLALAVAREMGSTRVHFPLVDDFLKGALGAPRTPYAITGIYFRPTMQFPEYWKGISGVTRQISKTLLMRSFLSRGDVGEVFCFDPYFVEFAAGKYREGAKVKRLPEPFDPPATIVPATISAGKVRFLLFGALQARKGISELLAALWLLPANVLERAEFIICGEGEMAGAIETAIPALSRRGLSLRFQRGFLPQAELDRELAKANVILAPYRGHLGSSGVIYMAAAMNRPVIAPVSGLIGRQVRDYGLGISIDTGSPSQIAGAIAELTSMLNEDHSKWSGRCRDFIATAGANKFAAAVLETRNLPTVLGG